MNKIYFKYYNAKQPIVNRTTNEQINKQIDKQNINGIVSSLEEKRQQ